MDTGLGPGMRRGVVSRATVHAMEPAKGRRTHAVRIQRERSVSGDTVRSLFSREAGVLVVEEVAFRAQREVARKRIGARAR